MGLDDINAYLTAGKNAVDLLKNLIPLLPKGTDTEKAAHELTKAEESLDASKAELAKALGYKLCKCTFPPQIMLWREDQKANVCGKCGHTDEPPPTINLASRTSWTRARRGDW